MYVVTKISDDGVLIFLDGGGTSFVHDKAILVHKSMVYISVIKSIYFLVLSFFVQPCFF